MRLVAQAFDEIKHRIARRQLERIPAWNKERFPAGISVRPFSDRHDRNFDPKPGQNLARGRKLPLPAVDQQEIGPNRLVVRVAIRSAFPALTWAALGRARVQACWGRVREGGGCGMNRSSLPLKGGADTLIALSF